ncbi:MAG: RnfABCDGE type electron transport complex subunit G [Oscillospiraceae bacterium]|nr:RnfABCDGE type electron transport complex subunit G [Oscillospiraceae bacterium]
MKKESTVVYFLRLTVTLLLICGIVAAVLAGVNTITKDKIAAIQEQKTLDAIAEVLPGVEGLEEMTLSGDTGIVKSAYASEEGYAVEVAPIGFDGEVTLMVGITSRGEVTGISVISHTETPGLGAVAAAKNQRGEAFRGQFVGQSGSLAVGENVDAISGATITSKAVTEGVNAALAFVAKNFGG